VPGQTSDSVEDGAGTISGGPGASRVISTATTTPDSSTSVPTETTDTQAVTPIADAPQTAENLGLGDDPNDPTQTVLLLDKNGIAYVVGPAGASGKVFKNDARADVQTGEWAVVVGLRSGPDGDQLWNKLAAACFNKTAECPTGQLAMVLDGTVISAPTVNEPEFTGGTVQISGSFTPEEARELAKILEFGAVPVKFGVATVQTVSPTLGKDSLRAALIAGLLGVLLVILFFFFYYRLLTLIVVGGLAVSGAFLWSIIAFLSKSNGLALTLSGVAGIIVSIGVTVDSYVVFFERLKDELMNGKTMKAAAQRSFDSAWRIERIGRCRSLAPRPCFRPNVPKITMARRPRRQIYRLTTVLGEDLRAGSELGVFTRHSDLAESGSECINKDKANVACNACT
jgi:preprotein translocase subunit SecD